MQNLDVQELIHLALFAASKDNHDDALGYLKQALVQEPNNSNTVLMLAAEYAEIQMFERAIEKFDEAITLNPELKIAQLQAGLLLVSLDRLEDAKVRLLPLNALGENDYFAAFAMGLLALIDEELTTSLAFLEKGCKINHENIPLNEDIGRIIDEIKQRLNQSEDASNEASSLKDSSDLLHSTYAH